MKSPRGIAWLPILLGVLALLVASGGAYWYVQQYKPLPGFNDTGFINPVVHYASSTSVPGTSQNSDIIKTKVITDTKLGISFSMPSAWTQAQQSESGYKMIVSPDYLRPHLQLLQGSYIAYDLYVQGSPTEYLASIKTNYGGPWKEVTVEGHRGYIWTDTQGILRIELYWQEGGRIAHVSFMDKARTNSWVLTTFLKSLKIN